VPPQIFLIFDLMDNKECTECETITKVTGKDDEELALKPGTDV